MSAKKEAANAETALQGLGLFVLGFDFLRALSPKRAFSGSKSGILRADAPSIMGWRSRKSLVRLNSSRASPSKVPLNHFNMFFRSSILDVLIYIRHFSLIFPYAPIENIQILPAIWT